MRGAEVERGLAPSAPLTDGVGSVLDREVDFPLAGYAGPGFHNWPGSADVLVGEYESGDSHPKKTFGETFGAATVAGYVGPGFPTWPSGHIPQDNGSESASPQPVTCQKDVRRRDRGQRPTATVDPDTKQRRKRPSRHCSRVRWPRFPQLAFGPHPSRQWLRIRFSAAGHLLKRRSAPRPGSATHGYSKPRYETTTQAAKPPL